MKQSDLCFIMVICCIFLFTFTTNKNNVFKKEMFPIPFLYRSLWVFCTLNSILLNFNLGRKITKINSRAQTSCYRFHSPPPPKKIPLVCFRCVHVHLIKHCKKEKERKLDIILTGLQLFKLVFMACV